MPTKKLSARILDTALQMAEVGSWEGVRLFDVAESLGIGLDQIHRSFPQKDDLAEAWFDRADYAVLRISSSSDFFRLSEGKRLHKLLMTWFESLAPYRRVTKEMLGYKFEFGHIHLQALGVMRISRTVQWFREAARLESAGLLRIGEEVILTSIFLAGFARWLNDESSGTDATRSYLTRLLGYADKAAKLVPLG